MSIQLENILMSKKGNRRSHPIPEEVGFPANSRKHTNLTEEERLRLVIKEA
ncbi:MAG: hypothetical protein ACYCXQ_04980 [Candidatus Humimicrobiaceae bacterium]